MRLRTSAFLVLLGAGCSMAAPSAPAPPPAPVPRPRAVDHTPDDGRLDPAVLAELQQDFEEAVGRGAHPDRIRQAKSLIDGSDSASRWCDYFEGLALLRRFRNDAAIPLLLANLYERPMRAGCTTFDHLLRALGLLAGEEFPRRGTTVEADIRNSVVVLLRTWYEPRRGDLTVVPERMTPARFRVATRLVVEEVRAGIRTYSGSPDSPETVASLLGRDASQVDRPSWHPEELVPAMGPLLLEWAGDPDLRYAVLPLLASLRKNGKAPTLHEVARDATRSRGVRFVALVALWKAGEDLDTPALAELLTQESDHGLKIGMILALGSSHDTALATPTLLRLLEDRNRHVRTAAVLALRRTKPLAALPFLKEILARKDDATAVYGALRLLSEMDADGARTALADFLRAELEAGAGRSFLTSALDAFGTATGRRWTEAGAHDEAYYRERTRAALQWWDAQGK